MKAISNLNNKNQNFMNNNNVVFRNKKIVIVIFFQNIFLPTMTKILH